MSYFYGGKLEVKAPPISEKPNAVVVPLVKNKPPVVLSAEDEKLLNDIRSAVVATPVSASAKRLMGKATPSQKQKGAKGDGTVFTSITIPAKLFRPVGRSSAVFRVSQEVLVSAAFTSSSALATFGAFNFVVSALDQISPLTALFDQYRIAMIELWVTPQGSAVSVTGNIASVIDYDDSNALTTYAQALDYVNVVSTEAGVAHYRRFVPHVAVAAYSGTFASFANETAPWIDAASTGVQHYGLKLAATIAGSIVPYDLHYRLHTEWRNVR